MRLLLIVLMGAVGLAGPAAWGAALPFSAGEQPPEVVVDTKKPRSCTIAWLLTDTATSDFYMSRMQVEPNENDRPSVRSMPCPLRVPPRMAARALDICLARAAEFRTCVFADMARIFIEQPELRATAENTSRCASDLASHIGVACWKKGDLSVCSVACGQSELEARDLARGRCEAKHQQRCDMTGAAPILAPQ